MTDQGPMTWPAAEAPSYRITELEGVPLDGPVEVSVRARSAAMLVLEVRMPAGSASNLHRHAVDSTGYVISGRVQGWLDGEEALLVAGDTFVHPAGVQHRVAALEDSHWIEIKSPPEFPFDVTQG